MFLNKIDDGPASALSFRITVFTAAAADGARPSISSGPVIFLFPFLVIPLAADGLLLLGCPARPCAGQFVILLSKG